MSIHVQIILAHENRNGGRCVAQPGQNAGGKGFTGQRLQRIGGQQLIRHGHNTSRLEIHDRPCTRRSHQWSSRFIQHFVPSMPEMFHLRRPGPYPNCLSHGRESFDIQDQPRENPCHAPAEHKLVPESEVGRVQRRRLLKPIGHRGKPGPPVRSRFAVAHLQFHVELRIVLNHSFSPFHPSHAENIPGRRLT